ncbi:hypothetical protein PILCRDRAFT_553847 [Piloderma croceum F 1598]|uniref:Uncharacterized protein n=1 Tax=Piloderma croceum (strain F 1598) TaxID=765440 RepID=A0A0C3BQZ1_PILCF|nr:hypothetical protein PILCRDRAFT_553847 [Piloderma croceum F 1598]
MTLNTQFTPVVAVADMVKLGSIQAVFFLLWKYIISDGTRGLSSVLAMASHPTLSLENCIPLLYGIPFRMREPTGQPAEIQMPSKEKRFRTTLDTLAALCVSEAQQEFAVSLSGTAAGVTLYVSQTGATPHHVAEHLIRIRTLLVKLKAEQSSPSAISTSLDPSDPGSIVSQLGVVIYRHSFPKFRHRFMRKQEAFFLAYQKIIASGQLVAKADQAICQVLFDSFTILRDVLEGISQPDDVTIHAIVAMLCGVYDHWQSYVDENSHDSMLSLWDRYGRFFPLATFLEKVFLFHAHLSTLLSIGMSDHYAIFLDGMFNVQVVEAQHKDVLIEVTSGAVGQTVSAICSYSSVTEEEVYNFMVGNILARAKARGKELPSQARPENCVKLLYRDTAVHCECVLVAHHYHNPRVPVLDYIGLSKRPCFACYAYIRAFNEVALDEKHGRTIFRMRSDRDTICFPWTSPTLAPASMDSFIREKMAVRFLYPAINRYAQKVGEELYSTREAAKIDKSPFDEMLGRDLEGAIARFKAHCRR